MTAKPWLVAVCAGRWQLYGIRAAQAAGLNVLALDADSHADGMGLADKSVVVDIRDPEKVVEAVRQSGIVPAGAIAFSAEAGMAAAARLRQEFGLPGAMPDVVHLLTDKAAQRQRWSETGIAGPKWWACREEAQILAAVAECGGNVVIKPTDSAGSRGVSVVHAGEDPVPAAKRALAASRGGVVLVESHMAGIEYTVESFSAGGITAVLAVTEKRKVPGTRGTVAFELATPLFAEEEIHRIGRFAADALAALDYTDGPAHSEIIRGEDGRLGMVESAGRGGGFIVAERLVPWASGFDLATACALQAVGRPVVPDCPSPQGIVLRFLPSRAGRVADIRGFEQAGQLEGVETAAMVAIGDQVRDADSDGDRLAYILARHPNAAEARHLADRVEAMITVELEPLA